MQQPAAAPMVELVRWQTATLVASAVAAIELVVLVVIGLAVLTGTAETAGEQRVAAAPPAKRTAPPPAAKAKPKPAAPTLARSQTTVLILNGNGVTGAAASTAARVEGAGYRIGAVGNAARTDYGRSLIMYRRGRQGEAERLARDLKIDLVAPLDGMRPRELGRAHVVLVVGG